jgi:tetratricopeptide (TPR) repeat protein
MSGILLGLKRKRFLMQVFKSIIFLLLFISAFPVQAKFNLNDEYLKIEAKLQVDPDNSNLLMDKAYIFTQGLEFDRAIQIYEQVLKKDEENLRAANELCIIYTQKGNKQKAYPVCELLTKLAPDNYLHHDNLGLSYFRLGDYHLALQAFTQAIKIESSSILTQYHLGQTFLALHEYQLTIDLFNQLLKQTDANLELKSLLNHGLYIAFDAIRDYPQALIAMRNVYDFSNNPLFVGKMVKAYIKANELLFFILISAMLLWFCHYLGKRLNRFLKNE